MDLIPIGLQFSAPGAAETVRQSDQVTAAAGRVERANDELVAANTRVAHSAQTQAAALRAQQAIMRSHAQATRLAGHEMTNLFRQFSDIGMMMSLGQNPMLILLQQGPQVAEVLGIARARGVTFAAAMRQVGAAVGGVLAPFAGLLAAVGATVAVLGGGFLLATRNINKEAGDLTKGLGLTAEQLKKVEQRSVTFGDTVMATFTVVGRHIMDGPVGKAIDWIGQKWNDLLDGVTRGAIAMAAGVSAAFQAAAAAMRGQNFGEAFSENFGRNRAGINSFFGEISSEAVARRRKQILEDAGKAGRSRSAPRDQTEERTAQVTALLERAKGDELQAQLALTKDIAARAAIERQIGAAALREQQAQLDRQIASIADDKGLTTAKKAELTAQLRVVKEINARVAGLKDQAVERQASEALDNQSIEQRREIAGLYERINAANTQGLRSAEEINRLEAAALRQRHIDERVEQQTRLAHSAYSEAAKAQAATALREAQAAELAAADRQRQSRLIQESQAIAEARLEAERAVLDSFSGLARTGIERRKLAERQLQLERQIERQRNLATLSDPLASGADRARAEAELASEAKRYGAYLRELQRAALLDGFLEMDASVRSVAGAIRAHDWSSAFTGLAMAIRQLQVAFSNAGTAADRVGAAAGLANAAGSVIGGKGGAALSGAAGGAMAGFQIGGPIGAAIGGVVGAIGGLLGASKAAKRALEEQRKAQEELNRAATQQGFDLWVEVLREMGHATSAQIVERQRMLEGTDPRNHDLARQLFALQDANAAEEMSLRLLEAQGRATEALALRRKMELEATTDALHPLLAMIYAEEDLATARAAARARSELEIRLMELQGNVAGALAVRRQMEMEAAEASLRPLLQLIYAEEDLAESRRASAAMAEAQTNVWATAHQNAIGRVSALYSSIRSELEQTREKYQALGDTLRSAIEGLDAQLLGPTASRAEFDRVANMAALGDADAMSRLAGMVDNQVEAIRATARTELEAQRGIARVREQLLKAEGTANRQATIAEQQLAAVNEQVKHLIDIDQGVQGLNTTMVLLAQAVANANGLGAIRDPKWGAVQNIEANKELARVTGFGGAFGGGEWQGWIVQQTAAIRELARQVLINFGQEERIVGFASGGYHAGGLRVVGERGPEIEATGPARYWSHEQAAEMLRGGADGAEVADAIAGLADRLDRIERNTARGADAGNRTKDLVEEVIFGGESFQMREAS